MEAQEKAVGPFRADILCKDIGTNAWVLIENQLERTDHSHLGQLLTYASRLEAVTIVWIAARFTEEHRSTLDWLNRITDETFRFFGVEVELWRIGTSPAAPRFNIVSKPNNWNKLVSQAARAIDESELTSTKALQVAYWGALGSALMAVGGPLARERKPQPQSWMSYSIGRSGFGINASMARPKQQVRAELYMSNPHSKAFSTCCTRRRRRSRKNSGTHWIGKSCQKARTPASPHRLTTLIPKDRRTGLASTNGS